MTSNLSVNNEKINDIFYSLFDNPMEFYKAIQKLMFFVNIKDVDLTEDNIYSIEKLREIFIAIDAHNKNEAFERILNALGVEESDEEKKPSSDLYSKMKALKNKIEKGELNIQK